jgi:ABC-type multidrug transport system fused ATPase/permease subunit
MALLFKQDPSVQQYDGYIDSIDGDARNYEVDWRRDYENESTGIIGRLRDQLREVKQSEFPESLEVKVSHLNYTSHPLKWRLPSMCEIVIRPFQWFNFLRSKESEYRLEILSDINFTLPKKSMTLVIGSPGSGKVSSQHLLNIKQKLMF